MSDLIEDTLASDVVIRRAGSTDVEIRPGVDAAPPVVGVGDGTIWARAEPDGPGVDLGHGTIDVVVRAGTALLEAHGGSGLVIAVRGAVEVFVDGQAVRLITAGHAVAFDATGHVGDPSDIGAAELADDPFVGLNLVLDALGGVPTHLAAAGDTSAEDSPVTPASKSRKIRRRERRSTR